MTTINITKDVQALQKFNEVKALLEESTTYYFSADNTPIHEDDWTEQQGESGNYWYYVFMADEEGLLNYYLGESATDEEVNNLCHVLMLGTGNNQDFHHALFLVLKEFR